VKRKVLDACLLLAATAAVIALGGSRPARADGPFNFYPLPLCTVFDTRSASGPTGGHPLTNGTTTNFTVQGVCGVPHGAKLAMLELVAVAPTGAGFLRVFQAGTSLPAVSTSNYPADPTGAIAVQTPVSLASTTPDISINPDVSGSSPATVHVVCSVSGYFQ
jgi:hypothetical protein